MKKLRIYIDTSVIGGCFDDEFKDISNRLFASFQNDMFIPVVSETVIDELTNAPEHIQDKIKELDNLLIFENTTEVIDLAQKYLDINIVTEKYYDDALHIASATVNKVDVLVSWNFKHIVNLNRIHLFNSVNLREGYSVLEIRSPREVLND